MTVCLDNGIRGDVAVLHGVDTDPAILHLCRSLITGTAFDVHRALVIDLGGHELSAVASDALDAAATARLRRRQLVTATTDAADAEDAVRMARAWLRRIDHHGTAVPQSLVRRGVGVVPALVDVGLGTGLRLAKQIRRRVGASSQARSRTLTCR